jgi:RNA polymerase sigma factor (sigma-70 family)
MRSATAIEARVGDAQAAERPLRVVRTEMTPTTMSTAHVGNREAFTALYDEYGARCYGLARRILRDERLAEDAVQEVFLAVWRGASRHDPARGSVASWLLTMTHHKAVDAVRREENGRKRRAPLELLNDEAITDPGVDQQAVDGVARDHVRGALAGLPPAQREPLVLAYFGGYTQREIAELTRTPLGTVKTRMLSGMRKLRAELKDLQPGTDQQWSTP